MKSVEAIMLFCKVCGRNWWVKFPTYKLLQSFYEENRNCSFCGNREIEIKPFGKVGLKEWESKL